VLRSHFTKYRSLMPPLALLAHLIDGVDGRGRGRPEDAGARRWDGWRVRLPPV